MPPPSAREPRRLSARSSQPPAYLRAFRKPKCSHTLGNTRAQKGPGLAPRPLALLYKGPRRYELALILLSIRSTRLSRSLLRFSNSRSFLSSSAERSSSFSVTSATVKVS